jgi:glycerophosphoryl diester phosphodiesterase
MEGYSVKTDANNGLINLRDYAGFGDRQPLIIAHKGGVITPDAPENSLAAIRLAADHRYDMVEIDVQEPRDGEPIVTHDANLLRNCGVGAEVRNLTHDEVSAIVYRASDQHIATLAEALALCQSLDMGVMLDLKIPLDPPPSTAFLQRIGELLEMYQLLAASVTISMHPLARQVLDGKVLFPVSNEDMRKASQGATISLQGQYWFGLPEELPSEAVEPLQRNGVFVIPAINGFRYPAHAHHELARQDAERLLSAGVDGFQIDSMYEEFF